MAPDIVVGSQAEWIWISSQIYLPDNESVGDSMKLTAVLAATHIMLAIRGIIKANSLKACMQVAVFSIPGNAETLVIIL